MAHSATTANTLTITPIHPILRKASSLGAAVHLPSTQPLLSLSMLTQTDISTLRTALFTHSILIFRKQLGIPPTLLPELSKLFDDAPRDIHANNRSNPKDQRNVLAAGGSERIPGAAQVQVIGRGTWDGYLGIERCELVHVEHQNFHAEPCSAAELEAGFTRPYRWHMDAPVYENLPGCATVLHSIVNPELPDQRLRFPDGEVLNIAAGATAFYSGARAFALLTSEERTFALRTTVNYAPRAYEWMRNCKATSDGLTIAGSGHEKPLELLEPFDWEKVHSYPMVWRNPGTGAPHLQIPGCCVYSLTTTDAQTGQQSTVTDLDEVRRICWALTEKVYRTENIFAHRWEEGDLVVFHNRGVLHSITGQLMDKQAKRLFWQCSIASAKPPEAYER